MSDTPTYRRYTTIVIGENHVRYDLGKLEYLPKGVMAINAFTEEIPWDDYAVQERKAT